MFIFRWTRDALAAPYAMWLEGASLAEISKQYRTSPGRLRCALLREGYSVDRSLQKPRPPKPRKPRPYDPRPRSGKRIRTSTIFDHRTSVVEKWKPRDDFDGRAHYAARHYTSSFNQEGNE